MSTSPSVPSAEGVVAGATFNGVVEIVSVAVIVTAEVNAEASKTIVLPVCLPVMVLIPVATDFVSKVMVAAPELAPVTPMTRSL